MQPYETAERHVGDFDVLLTVRLSIILVINQLMHKILFYNKFIIFLYMIRALLCSSSGGQNCIIQHLVSSHTVGGRPVHRLREDSQNVLYSIWYRHTCRWPSGAQVERGPVHRTATYSV